MRPNSAYRDPRLPESFWTKTRLADEGSCWLWTAAKTNGYGAFWDKPNRRLRPAHRFAYEVLVGPVPPGLVLDHESCSQPSCVNPDHLVPKTINENGRRERGNRCFSKRHELVGDNVLIKHSKRWGEQRNCRACRNEKRRLHRALHGRAEYDKERRK